MAQKRRLYASDIKAGDFIRTEIGEWVGRGGTHYNGVCFGYVIESPANDAYSVKCGATISADGSFNINTVLGISSTVEVYRMTEEELQSFKDMCAKHGCTFDYNAVGEIEFVTSPASQFESFLSHAKNILANQLYINESGVKYFEKLMKEKMTF